MKSKKQSSIEWLIEQIIKEKGLVDLDIQQAKQLHKQEIIYAYEVAFSDGWNDVKYDKPKYSDAEQYYKDTY